MSERVIKAAFIIQHLVRKLIVSSMTLELVEENNSFWLQNKTLKLIESPWTHLKLVVLFILNQNFRETIFARNHKYRFFYFDLYSSQARYEIQTSKLCRICGIVFCLSFLFYQQIDFIAASAWLFESYKNWDFNLIRSSW